jgi:hypothetical protein
MARRGSPWFDGDLDGTPARGGPRQQEAGGRMKRLLALAAALLAAGCATTYHLTLMPRDSGRLYQGTADDTGGSEGAVAITIEGRTYTGTWVETVPDRSTGYVTGGVGRHGYGLGGTFSVDNPGGGQAKALLRSPDGAGLRCDFQGIGGRGGGICRDDRGLEYDVQIRPAPGGG